MTRPPTMDPIHPAPHPRAGESSTWHALVDGQLPLAQAQALREQLQDDQEAQATLAHWQAQREQLHALHQDLLHAPVPDTLMAAALRATDRREQQAQRGRWGGMAASVLLAFVLGWTGRGQWPAVAPGKTLATGNGSTPLSPTRCTSPKSASPWKLQPPSRTTWCNGCPSGWTARSRFPRWARRVMNWWAVACCLATPGCARSSCTRTAQASASRCTWAPLLRHPPALAPPATTRPVHSHRPPQARPHSSSRKKARCQAFTGRTRALATP